MARVFLLGSLSIDFIGGVRRCGGSGFYSPIPLYILGVDFVLYYVASSSYPFRIPFSGRRVDADRDFVFSLTYLNDERVIRLSSFPSHVADVDVDFRDFGSVLVNPLFNEFSLDVVRRVVSESRVSSFDLQGFLRERHSNGAIFTRRDLPREVRGVLEDATIVKVSEEEFFFEDLLGEVFVVTRGARGCSIYLDGEWVHIPTVFVDRVPVGTGDMFVSYYTYCYSDIGDAVECGVRSNALISAIMEVLDFNFSGCLSGDVFDASRSKIIDLWRERIDIIRSRL